MELTEIFGALALAVMPLAGFLGWRLLQQRKLV